MSAKKNIHLANIDHDAKLLLKTVEQHLLPTLEKVQRFQQSDQRRVLTTTEKKPIADLFVTTSTQLDALWYHLRPEFDVDFIVPKDVPPPNAPPMTLVMSKTISPEERDSSVLPMKHMQEAEMKILSDEERDTLRQCQAQHAESLQQFIRMLATSYAKDGDFATQIKLEKNRRLRELSATRMDLDEAKNLVRKAQQKL